MEVNLLFHSRHGSCSSDKACPRAAYRKEAYLEAEDAVRALTGHHDVKDIVNHTALYGLEVYSLEPKCRSHAVVLTFTINPAADPLDPLSRHVFKSAGLIAFSLLKRRLTTVYARMAQGKLADWLASIARAQRLEPQRLGEPARFDLVWFVRVEVPNGYDGGDIAVSSWQPESGARNIAHAADWKAIEAEVRRTFAARRGCHLKVSGSLSRTVILQLI